MRASLEGQLAPRPEWTRFERERGGLMAGRLHSVWLVIFVVLFGCGTSKRDSIGAVSGPSSTPIASPDAGGSSNPCDGLRPGPPEQPVTFKETLFLSSAAFFHLADAEGNVLLGTAGGFGQLGYSIRAPDGGLLGTADFAPEQQNGLTVPLASGFAGVLQRSGPDLVRVTPDGGVQDMARLNDFGVTAADPRGGLVLLTADALTAYDDDMRQRFTLPLQLPGALQAELGVDVAGNILILFGANARVYDLKGLWVDAAGNPGTSFSIAQQVVVDENTFSLAPDVHGGLFLWHQVCLISASDQCTSQWERRYAPLSTSPEPAPDWLAARGGVKTFPLAGPTPEIRLIHGQSGYALFGAPEPDCAVEVLTADGMSCGFADFAAQLASFTSPVADLTANSGASPPCHSTLDIGRDGTVLALDAQRTTPPCDNQGACPVSYDWFPAYFR